MSELLFGVSYSEFAFLGTGIFLGIIIGVWFSLPKKDVLTGFPPNELAKWNVETDWANIFSEKPSPQDFANRELAKLEKVNVRTRQESDELEESFDGEMENIRKIRSTIEDLDKNNGPKIEIKERIAIPLGLAMARLSGLRLDTDRINDLVLPFRRRKEFLKAVIDGLSQTAITKQMRRVGSGGFQEHPNIEAFRNMLAEWDALHEIDGLQEKILREMLSVKSSEE